MDSTTIFYIVLSGIVSLIILYFIVKAAVRAGTQEIRYNMQFKARLEAIEMVENGEDMTMVRNLYYENDEAFFGRLLNIRDAHQKRDADSTL